MGGFENPSSGLRAHVAFFSFPGLSEGLRRVSGKPLGANTEEAHEAGIRVCRGQPLLGFVFLVGFACFDSEQLATRESEDERVNTEAAHWGSHQSSPLRAMYNNGPADGPFGGVKASLGFIT